MKFIVYSKESCPYCVKVKQVLDLAGQEYITYTLNKDFNREQFYQEFGNGSTFPQVILNETKLGGCNDTIKYLQENKII